VPAYGRQEVAVLQGGRPGLQVLRAPHAPRPQPFKKACGNAARPPLPTALLRGTHRCTAPRRCHQWRQLPEPFPLPGHRRNQSRRRGHQHLEPVLLAVGFFSTEPGQYCHILSSWWGRQRSQVSVTSIFLFPPCPYFVWSVLCLELIAIRGQEMHFHIRSF
jgi:hypothetical protein